MWRDAWLVGSKDLRVEWVSKVATSQILPFGLVILVMFGLAISPDLRVVVGGNIGDSRSVLQQVAPGLFWMAILFAALLALSRSFGIEQADSNFDAIRLAGLDPAGFFLGKTFAVAVQLVVLELVLGLGAFVLFGSPLQDVVLLVTAALVATVGMASAGTMFAALASGQRLRETLVPLLVFPVLTPVLLGATASVEAAMFGPSSAGWPWVGLLATFALVYLGAGMVAFGPLLEET